MMQRVSLCSLLVLSLSCFGQVVANGGYAANVAPSAALAPLTSTPDIALPGSGPAVGAPLGNSNANDSRFATGPSFASRNELPAGAMPQAETTAPGTTNAAEQLSSANAAAASEPFNAGIQHFVSGAPGAVNNGQSLAEIAKQARGESHRAARVFTNESIQQLNARGVRTGNLAPPAPTLDASNASDNASSQPTGTLLAQNEAGPLPQSDQSAPPARTANQRRQTPSTQAPVNTPAATTATDQPADSAQRSSSSPALPQTGSSLPLLLLVGFVGLAAGTIYLFRR